MTPEHRFMVAYLAASLKAGRTFTHVHDHDAGREIPVGGVVRPDVVNVIEGLGGVKFSGKPDMVMDHGTQTYIQLAVEEGGFSGYDYASEKHFKGLFADQGAVQLFDHETGRYHDFHVS